MATQTQTPKDNKAAAKPPTNGANGAKDTTAETSPEEVKPTRAKKYIFIVTGEIKQFENAREAEEFLNGDEDVPETFRVIKGNLIEQKQKVSLR